MLLYNIIEEHEFTEAFDELVKQHPRLAEIKCSLDFLLSHRPFEIGAPIPKNPKSAYGAYLSGTEYKLMVFLARPLWSLKLTCIVATARGSI